MVCKSDDYRNQRKTFFYPSLLPQVPWEKNSKLYLCRQISDSSSYYYERILAVALLRVLKFYLSNLLLLIWRSIIFYWWPWWWLSYRWDLPPVAVMMTMNPKTPASSEHGKRVEPKMVLTMLALFSSPKTANSMACKFGPRMARTRSKYPKGPTPRQMMSWWLPKRMKTVKPIHISSTTS